GHRHLPHPQSQAVGVARDAVGEWTTGRRGPRVRRRGHPGPGLRGEEISGMSTDSDLEEFTEQIADQVESFLLSLQAIASAEDAGRAVSLLLLEVSQVLLAGARLGVQADFTPVEEFQPDAGPDPDL